MFRPAEKAMLALTARHWQSSMPVCLRAHRAEQQQSPLHLPPRVTDTSPSVPLWISRSRREEGGGLPRLDTHRSATTSTTPEGNKVALIALKYFRALIAAKLIA